jgi:thiamine-phosphate pyrophosphorylase
MKLIVITAESFLEGEAEALNLLFENGLKVLHLRKPHASQNETKAFIEEIKPGFHPRIVLHDYYDLTGWFDLKGIHLNSRNQEAFFRVIDSGRAVHIQPALSVSGNGNMIDNKRPADRCWLSVSRSCHSLEEIMESPSFDYLFLSPVFDSISKTDYKQGFTPERLREAKSGKIIGEKVIALGGITAENVPVVRDYGFGGIAVLGALWSDFERNSNMNELLKLFNELEIKCEGQ